MFENFIASITDALYSYILIILLVTGGISFTLRTKFVQFRLIKEQIKAFTEKPTDGKGVLSFQSFKRL